MADYTISLGVDLKVGNIRKQISDYNAGSNKPVVKLGVEFDKTQVSNQINRIRPTTPLLLNVQLNQQSLTNELNRIRTAPVGITVTLDDRDALNRINNIRQQLLELNNLGLNNGGLGNGGRRGGRGAAREVNEVTRAYRELISLQSRMGSKQQKLLTLDTSRNGAEIVTLSNSIDDLFNRYQRLRQLFNGQFSDMQLDALNRGFQKTRENLDAVSAKAADARAALARSINVELGNGGIEKEIVKIESDISRLQNVSNSVRTAMNEVRLAFGLMQEASAAGNMDDLITANRLYEESLRAVKNQLDINKTTDKTSVREQTQAYRELLSISKEIGSLETNIARLKEKGGSSNQISVLENQLQTLRTTYQNLATTMGTPLTNEQWGSIYTQLAQTSDKIAQLKAQYADARAEFAMEIKANINSAQFTNEIGKITSRFDNIKNKSQELQSAMNGLNAALAGINAAAATDDVAALIQANADYEAALKRVKNQLEINERAERTAAATRKLEGDRKAFISGIDNWLTKNSAAATKFGAKMRELQMLARDCDAETLKHLINEFKMLDGQADAAGLKIQKFGDRLKTQFKKYSTYFSAASIIMYGIRAARSMFEQVKAIDSAMTELKKVTNESDASYNNFLGNAASRAKELGTTIDGLVSSTADFARLGYGFKDAQGLAEVANIYAVVGDEVDGVEGATESLISTMAAFKDSANDMSNAEFAMSIADKFNEIGNNFAISSGGIGEAMKRSASSLDAANNTLDESIALITAANTVVQDPDTVGTAFKTISMRIRGAKTELEDAGLETDGMVESTAKLREEIMALSGVDIMEADRKTFKSTYDILDELATKWGSLTDIQQASITELIAGKRQGNIVSSLMQNFDVARDALKVSMNESEGSMMTEHAKWSDSIEAHLNRLKATWQSFAQTFMDSDSLKAGIDALAGLVNILDELVQNFGVIGTISLGVISKNVIGYYNDLKKAKIDAIATTEAETKANTENAASENAEATASANAAAANEAEAAASESATVADATEAVASETTVTADVAETVASETAATADATEAVSSEISAAADDAEAVASGAAAEADAAEAVASGAAAEADAAEAVASGAAAEADAAEAVASGAAAEADAAEATASLGAAAGDAGEAAAGAAGGFSKFFGTLGGKVAIVAAVAAAIGLIYNQIKKAKEAAAELRQETISSSNEFLDAAKSFEKAYIKYSGKTNLTTEEENELIAAIDGTVSALDDKSSALQNAVNSCDDYVDALERIARAELIAAASKAEEKKEAAQTDLEEAVIGWTALDGSEVDVSLSRDALGNLTEASKIAKEIASGYFEIDPNGNMGVLDSLTLGTDASVAEIIDYYNTLIAVKEELEKSELKDTDVYENITEAIDKMSGAVETYKDAVYDAAKAQYQLDNGIPKTVEDYLAMREYVIANASKTLNPKGRLEIANALDSEYRGLFDLTSAYAQSRGLIGVIGAYRENNAIEMEAFLNMRTAVNNNECSIGDYISQFNDIKGMADDWGEDGKEVFNSYFGLDTDVIKQQYDYAFKYIKSARASSLGINKYTSVEDAKKLVDGLNEEISDFLNKLTKTEFTAFINVQGELDLVNGTEEEWMAQIEEEAKILEALSFTVNLETETAALESFATAMSEVVSGAGLSSESMSAIEDILGNLDSYDQSALFERTANGIRLNSEEFRRLNDEYRKTNIDGLDGKMDALGERYFEVREELSDLTYGTEEYNKKAAELGGIEAEIKALETLASQYEGVASAYQTWQRYESAGSQRDMYEGIIGGLENVDDEISRGWLDDGTIEFLRLIKGDTISATATTNELMKAYKSLGDTIDGTKYSIRDFFTVNEDGESTNTGVYNFLDAIDQKFDDKFGVIKRDDNGNIVAFDFKVVGGDKAVADALGISEELVQIMVRAADDAGFVVSMDGTYQQLDVLKEKAQEAADVLKNTYKVTRFSFDLNTSSKESVFEQYQEALNIWEEFAKNKNEDGTINMEVDGAEEAFTLVSTLQSMVDKLSEPAYMELDTTQVEKDIQTPLSKLQEYERLTQTEHQLQLKGTDTSEIESSKAEILDYFEGLDPEVKAKIGIDEMSREEIQAKLEAGEIEIPATIDLQVEMNNTLRDMVNIALYNAGIIDKEELEKRVDVSIYADEVDASDVQEKTKSAISTADEDEGAVESRVKVIAETVGAEDVSNLRIEIGNLKDKTVQTVAEVSGQSLVDNLSSSIDGLKSKTITITTVLNTVNSSSKSRSDSTSSSKSKNSEPSFVNGTAFANGSVGRAYRQGDWRTKKSETALTGELGRELVVTGNRWYTVGDNGAEFVNIPSGSIVFNHKQTEEIFKNGKVVSDGGRGTVYANGTAFAEGTAYRIGSSSGLGGIGKAIGKAVEPIFKKAVDGSTKGKIFGEGSIGNNDGTVGAVTSDKSGSGNGSGSDDAKDEFEEVIDWIEVAIARIEIEIDNLDKKASSVYDNFTSRNTALTEQLSKVRDEIELQEEAYDRYIQEANSVGLDESWAEKVRNGEIDIETITDEELKEKIDKYKQWYEKALACEDAILDLKEAESALYAQRFENIETQYDGILQGYEHTSTMLDSYIAQAEAQGHIVSKKYYQALISNEQDNIEQLKAEQTALIAARDEAVASGAIEVGSEEWNNMNASIDEVTQSIEESTTSILEFSRAMEEIDWSIFDLIQERISAVTEEADFLIELMSNEKLFDDDGKLTSQGLATMGLHAQNYNTHMYQADSYAAEIAELNKQIAQDPFDQELINRRDELINLQRESILAAEEEKDAIRDMVEEGINLELDALQERIDKYNEALDSQKDLYDYQKKVKEQTKEIASLEKQMAAYQGDTSEEAQAKIQEIKLELENAKDDLEETEYDKYISDTEALLDTLYTEYELILNQRLDNIDYLLEQVITSINVAASADGTIATALGSDGAISIAIGNNATSIKDTLVSETNKVGTTLSSAMNNIWNSGDGNAKSVLTMYGEDFRTKSATIITTLNGIKTSVNSMVASLNKEAEKKVNANKTSTSAKKDPTKTATTTKKTTTKKSSGDGKPKVGDKVKYVSGIYYYDSQGVNPSGSKHRGKEVYITKIEDASWATHKYHISTGNKLGNGDLGWLKLNQLSGYATGKKNFLEDEIAWTQEGKKKEYIVRPSDGAILTPIAKGDSVLTSAASSNIWDMANSPAEFIKENLNLGLANVPNNSVVHQNYTQHLDNVVFSFPNVKNYDEMLSAMQRDKNFERLVLAMSIDRVAGKSSLAKGKSIR